MTNFFFMAAFFGGLLNFFSPCILPVLPLFLTYLAGVSLETLKEKRQAQRRVFYHALFFVAGMVVVYTLMGALAGFLGAKLFVRFKVLFLQISGLVIIVFGVYLLGWLKIPFLQRERRFQFKFKKLNYLTSLIQGIAFSFLWSPCTGPVLLGVLFMAETFETIQESTLAMFFFSLGVGIPLLFTSLLTGRVAALVKKKSRFLPVIHKTSGLFLILVGLLLLTKKFYWLSRLISQLYTGLN